MSDWAPLTVGVRKGKNFKRAVLVASAIEVVCPDCGGAQPNTTDGSHMWTADEIGANQGKRTCVECDEPFHLSAQNKVGSK